MGLRTGPGPPGRGRAAPAGPRRRPHRGPAARSATAGAGRRGGRSGWPRWRWPSLVQARPRTRAGAEPGDPGRRRRRRLDPGLSGPPAPGWPTCSGTAPGQSRVRPGLVHRLPGPGPGRHRGGRTVDAGGTHHGLGAGPGAAAAPADRAGPVARRSRAGGPAGRDGRGGRSQVAPRPRTTRPRPRRRRARPGRGSATSAEVADGRGRRRTASNCACVYALVVRATPGAADPAVRTGRGAGGGGGTGARRRRSRWSSSRRCRSRATG